MIEGRLGRTFLSMMGVGVGKAVNFAGFIGQLARGSIGGSIVLAVGGALRSVKAK